MKNLFFILPLLFCIGCNEMTNESSTDTDENLGVCGDLIINGNEECDEFSDDCSNCILARKVFVTEMEVNGLWPIIFEWKCYDIAKENGLYRGLDWLGWVSTSSSDIRDEIFQSPFKYERLDGVLVASNFDDLVDGTIQNPINIDENGFLIEDRAWTGTDFDGISSGWNCLDWNDQYTELGTFGWTTATNSQWSNGGTVRCSEKIHIYCIESENFGVSKQQPIVK